MGKFSRDKGKRGERKTANEIKESFPWLTDVKRGLQSRGGGAEAPDVVGVPGLHIEVKTGKLPNPRAALSQAKKDCAGVTYPVAVIRDNRQQPFVVMDWSDFRAVIEPWLKEKKKWDLTQVMTEVPDGEPQRPGASTTDAERHTCENETKESNLKSPM